MSTLGDRARALALGTSFLGVLAPLVRGRSEHPFETDALRRPTIETDGTCVIRGATIHTATQPAFVGDVLVLDGKIAAIGDVSAPEGTAELDAHSRHLAPGVVDCHSHMAIEGGVNEGTVSISAEVTIKDVVDADDVAIYRALAGGATTVRLLHGSANAIGGRDEILKLKWGVSADELRFPGAPQGVKFALGENPKRPGERGDRFPATRMGVEAIYYRAFERAREYDAEWAAYETALARGDDPQPPRRDLRLDVLRGILKGTVLVHSHCYRADEILMLIRASQHFGFRIATLQHVLEGYKVAYEIAAAGVGGSTFSDWWAYKIEAYDAIPQNAALMAEAGVLTSLNSDSDEMVRRLYSEAAKSVRYAGLDRVTALQLVTLNPARQLGIDDRVGSIEVGKDADLTLLNADPLSALARVDWTMVDGQIQFTRRDAFGLDRDPPVVTPFEELSSAVPPAPPAEGGSSEEIPVVALVGGTLHPVSEPDIEDGILLLQGGRIVGLGADVEVPADAEVLDVTGLDVWPGMISLNSAVGLYEIGAVAETVDTSEIGGSQPDLRVAASLNAESAHIGVTRHNGVTRAQPTPTGGPISGQSAVVRLNGDTWEEMLFRDRDMLHIRFPRTANDAEDKEDAEQADALARLFEDAREWGRVRDEAHEHQLAPPPHDPRLAALVPFARGEKPVALHASNAQTILFAVEFAKEHELDAVLYGGSEAWKVVEVLAEEGIPVVVGPVWALPRSDFDPYDAAFANAAVLHRAGVPFALCTNDRSNERNLAFQAATAAAYGLPPEEALRAVTLYPARILGVDDVLGSLAAGKLADVVVTRGDLLEITSPVEYLFIDGELIDHRDDRQTRFYERYRSRLERRNAQR